MEAMAHLWMIFPAIETSIDFGDVPWRTVQQPDGTNPPHLALPIFGI